MINKLNFDQELRVVIVKEDAFSCLANVSVSLLS